MVQYVCLGNAGEQQKDLLLKTKKRKTKHLNESASSSPSNMPPSDVGHSRLPESMSHAGRPGDLLGVGQVQLLAGGRRESRSDAAEK